MFRKIKFEAKRNKEEEDEDEHLEERAQELQR